MLAPCAPFLVADLQVRRASYHCYRSKDKKLMLARLSDTFARANQPVSGGLCLISENHLHQNFAEYPFYEVG